MEIEKECEMCGTLFITKNKKKRCCTQSCSNKLMWKENREKMLKCHNSPDARKKNSNAQKRKWKDPSYKQVMHESKKKYANTSEAKEKFLNRIRKWQTENHVEYLNMRKEISNRPEIKKAVSSFQTQLWKNPEYRKLQSERFSRGQLRRWANTDEMIQAENDHGKYKDYVFPSGETVRVQGYEDMALNILLEHYDESDIFVGVKKINDEIGIIRYMFENKERRYYPDIYIKSINTIIEVKSDWTFEHHKEKNLAKEKECLQLGFNFEFMIL